MGGALAIAVIVVSAVAACLAQLSRDTQAISVLDTRSPRTMGTVGALCCLDAGFAVLLASYIPVEGLPEWADAAPGWIALGSGVPTLLGSRRLTFPVLGVRIGPGTIYFLLRDLLRERISDALGSEKASEAIALAEAATSAGISSHALGEAMRLQINLTGVDFLGKNEKGTRRGKIRAVIGDENEPPKGVYADNEFLRMRRLVELAYMWRMRGLLRSLRRGTFKAPPDV